VVLQYNDSMGPAAGKEINEGKPKPFLPKSNMRKVPICVMACVCTVLCMYVCMYVYASKTQRCGRAVGRGVGVGGCSLGAAGRSTGLVEVHGFAQPAGKVHFFHF